MDLDKQDTATAEALTNHMSPARSDCLPSRAISEQKCQHQTMTTKTINGEDLEKQHVEAPIAVQITNALRVPIICHHAA